MFVLLVSARALSPPKWVTSSSCSSSLCNQVGGRKYDSSAAFPTGQIITLQYAIGEAGGMAVWDTVNIGGYNIANQALST